MLPCGGGDHVETQLRTGASPSIEIGVRPYPGRNALNHTLARWYTGSSRRSCDAGLRTASSTVRCCTRVCVDRVSPPMIHAPAPNASAVTANATHACRSHPFHLRNAKPAGPATSQ